MTFKATGKIVYKTARKIVITVIGVTLFVFGIIMLITPGPGIAAIISALALLGLEFAWARRWLKVVKERSQEAAEKAGNSNLWQHFRQRLSALWSKVKTSFVKKSPY